MPCGTRTIPKPFYAIKSQNKMKTTIENVHICYPTEEDGMKRDLIIFPDGDFLQLNFGKPGVELGTIALTKTEADILRDTLNTILKNNLID